MSSPPPPPTPPPGYQYQYGHGPYDQWYGYGPPGVQPGPKGQVAGDDITWGVMCYIGTLVFGFPAPLIIYFVKKNTSAYVRFHAAQALNYQLTILIQILAPLVVAVPLAVLTDNPAWLILIVPLAVFHAFAQWVFLILGTVKAGQGHHYRFPTLFCFPMIR